MLLQLGLLVTLALLGAVVARRLGHSMMIAYVLVGVLVGPFSPLPWKVITIDELESGPITLLAKLGVIFIMFFVGLEFSLGKLRKLGGKAAVLAATDLSASLFVGFSVCIYFGYGLVDSFFVACIVAMSSTAVTMKVMEELDWQETKGADALIGLMVVEDVVSIILLTLANGFVFEGGSERSLLVSVLFVAVLMGFYLILIVVFIPSVMGHIQRVKHEELFVLLAISTVILSASLAESFGLSAFIGSFFIGMAFAETPLAERLRQKTVAFRDAFAAIFFVSFGMMINPYGLERMIPLLAVLVPCVIIVEVMAVSSMAYLMGYGSKDAMLIGSGTTSRSEDAIVFASVGGSLRKADGTSVLSPRLAPGIYPMTGAFCLAMSSATPYLVRNSARLADWLAGALPRWLTFSGRALADAVSTLVEESPHGAEFRQHIGYALGACLTMSVLTLGLGPTIGYLPGDLLFGSWGVRAILLAGVLLSAQMLRHSILYALGAAHNGSDGTKHSRREFYASNTMAAFALAAMGAILVSGIYYSLSFVVVMAFIAYLIASASAFAKSSPEYSS
jgi:CPA2 family monovalent cation:H+ antiporter-2